LDLFEGILSRGLVPATFVATFLTETCKSLQREGVAIETLPDAKMEALFGLVGRGTVAKEALTDLLKWQVSHLNQEPADGLASLGLQMLTEREVEDVVARVIEKNKKLVEERGPGAFSSIMGAVMSEVRGKADPKLVTEIIKKRLTKG
jgi:glutamyl-tRNA(Gln) amidotransferase subunit E